MKNKTEYSVETDAAAKQREDIISYSSKAYDIAYLLINATFGISYAPKLALELCTYASIMGLNITTQGYDYLAYCAAGVLNAVYLAKHDSKMAKFGLTSAGLLAKSVIVASLERSSSECTVATAR